MSTNIAKVLVVDDDSSITETFRTFLEKQGYEVHCANSSSQALELLKSTAFDLVILDIIMPEVDGYEVLRRIRKTRSMVELPVIVITALKESSHIVVAMELGANDFISKPIDFTVALARVRTQLMLKELSASNERFLSIASHDIKKPLLLIRDMLHVISQDYAGLLDKEQDLATILGDMCKTTDKMQNFINEFLEQRVIEMGRIVLEKDYCDINDVVESVVADTMSMARNKNISLTLDLTDQPPGIYADKGRLSQVVDNLISNAVKFSPMDTTTTVRTSSRNNNVVLEVVDEGPGFQEDELPHVFDKYAPLSNKPTAGESSTGLGLAICKLLVQMHNGDISVSNNDGPGATFTVTFPVKEGNTARSA